MADPFYAHKGDRIETPDGQYLGIVARDLDGSVPGERWVPSMFEDLQIDFYNPHQRLPLTSWLVRRIQSKLDIPHG